MVAMRYSTENYIVGAAGGTSRMSGGTAGAAHFEAGCPFCSSVLRLSVFADNHGCKNE